MAIAYRPIKRRKRHIERREKWPRVRSLYGKCLPQSVDISVRGLRGNSFLLRSYPLPPRLVSILHLPSSHFPHEPADDAKLPKRFGRCLSVSLSRDAYARSQLAGPVPTGSHTSRTLWSASPCGANLTLTFPPVTGLGDLFTLPRREPNHRLGLDRLLSRC